MAAVGVEKGRSDRCDIVSRARPFTNREGRKESGQIQYTILLCTVSNLRKVGRDYCGGMYFDIALS